MIWNKLGIVAGVYLGTRLTYRTTGEKVRLLRTPGQRKRASAATALSVRDRFAEIPPPAEKAQRHPFLGASALSLATASAGYFFFPALGPVTLALLTYSATPMFLRAERRLRRPSGKNGLRIDNEVYSALVSGACLFSGQWAAAAVYNALYHLGDKVAGERRGKVTEKSVALYAARLNGLSAWVLRDGAEIPTPVRRILPGEAVVVNSGETAPVDGTVVQGAGRIDSTDESGQLDLARVGVGDRIRMSAFLLEGRLVIRALCSGVECEARRIHDHRRRTRAYVTELQRKGEKWADRAALPFLGVGALAWPLFGIGPATALLFSSPATGARSLLSLQTAVHFDWAAEGGVVFRDPRAIDEIARIDTIVFDGIGALARPTPEAGSIHCTAAWEQNIVLGLAAAAEGQSDHPIAEALRSKARAMNLEVPPAEDLRDSPGKGVSALVRGQRVSVGGRAFILAQTGNHELPAFLTEVVNNDSQGANFIYLSVGRRILGAIELLPVVRRDASQTVAELRERGLGRIVLISKDSKGPCERIAKAVGIDEFYCGRSAREKADFVRRLRAQGRHVCYMGDALNDVLAMRSADVSICFDNRADYVAESSSILLIGEDLGRVVRLFDTARSLVIQHTAGIGSWGSFAFINTLFVVLLRFSPLQSSLLCAAIFGLEYREVVRLPKSLRAASKEQEQARRDADSEPIEGTAEVVR